jgi:ketosteroid isomerase-like protein
MDDRSRLLAANETFYRAFEQHDLPAMERLWARRSDDACVHPGWEICRGWSAVKASWVAIFGSDGGMRFQVGELGAAVYGTVGRVTCVENIWTSDGRALLGRVACTNLFLAVDGDWRMVLHHGSPIAGPGVEPPADEALN